VDEGKQEMKIVIAGEERGEEGLFAKAVGAEEELFEEAGSGLFGLHLR
jgi:hypothetical protein